MIVLVNALYCMGNMEIPKFINPSQWRAYFQSAFRKLDVTIPPVVEKPDPTETALPASRRLKLPTSASEILQQRVEQSKDLHSQLSALVQEKSEICDVSNEIQTTLSLIECLRNQIALEVSAIQMDIKTISDDIVVTHGAMEKIQEPSFTKFYKEVFDLITRRLGDETAQLVSLRKTCEGKEGDLVFVDRVHRCAEEDRELMQGRNQGLEVEISKTLDLAKAEEENASITRDLLQRLGMVES